MGAVMGSSAPWFLGGLLMVSAQACAGTPDAVGEATGHLSSYGSACEPSCEGEGEGEGEGAGETNATPSPVASSPTDGIKNGDETDVDCGGRRAPTCGAAKGCKAHADCASGACSYDHACVQYASCTAHFGGDTCGAGETGPGDARHESCCTRVQVGDRPADQGGPFSIDKYAFTAGRMRAIAERLDGNLRKWGFDHAAPGWDKALIATLPDSMDAVNVALGPDGKRGCNVAAQGARTFWQPPVAGSGAEYSDFSKDVLDEKALNCVPWTVAALACAYDGGHLVTQGEIAWLYENRGRSEGATAYPWQWNDSSPYDPRVADPRLVHRNNYATPNAPSSLRLVNNEYPLDHAFWIAPPGRYPRGANMHGVEDLAGNVMPWVADKYNGFTWTHSWEAHKKDLKVSTWHEDWPQTPQGYYAIGLRCAY